MTRPRMPGPWQQQHQATLDAAIDAAAAKAGMDPQEYRAEAMTVLRSSVRRARLGVLVPVHLLGQILEDGKLKTQQQTGFSIAGQYHPQARRLTEHLLYGYPLDHRGAGPVYGLAFEDMETVIRAVHCTGLGLYGQVLLEISPMMRRLTTIIMGDSMDNSGITDMYEATPDGLRLTGKGQPLRAPCTLGKPDLVAVGDFPLLGSSVEGFAAAHQSVDGMITHPAGLCRYYEIAIHGRVTTDMIEHIHWPSHLDDEVLPLLAPSRRRSA